MASSATNLAQVNTARDLALSNPTYYPAILPGVLPIISGNAALDVQRWGADFLAETFAAPTWSPDEKAKNAPVVLPVLKEFVESQDTAVLKSSIQAASCIYPLVYRHMYVPPSPDQVCSFSMAVGASY